MRARSIILGLATVAFLSLWGYFNDHVMRCGEMIGDLMPALIYGGMIAVLLVADRLLRCVGRGFSNRELAAILGLCLIACSIPGRFTQCMPASVMLPRHDERLRPGWQQEQVVDLLPSRMLPDISENESRALNGFVTGLSTGDTHIGVLSVPWRSWFRPLAFWVPLMVLLTVATLGLALVFHRQWSHHEQLPYPLSVFAHSLLANDDLCGGRLFRSRLFWCGFALVFGIELNNYLCRWWPEILIPVSLRFDFSALASRVPTLVSGKGMTLLYPRILFPVVGLAFFLPSDISLSMTAGPVIYCFIAGIFASYGVELRPGKEMALSIEGFLYSGGYFGILLMLLYTGRHYYWHVLRRALFLSSPEPVPGYAVDGCRLALICTLGCWGLLIWVGIPAAVAGVYLGLALMVYCVVSRVLAETGAYIVGTFVFPGVLIWGFAGVAAVGPATLLCTLMLSVVLLLIPGRAPMAFAVQSLKLMDWGGVDLRKALRWGAAAMLLAFVLALPSAIYWQYDRGTPSTGWPRKAATFPFENTVDAVRKLKAQGRYEAARDSEGPRRLALVRPSIPHVAAFSAAASLAILFGAGRLFFQHWPLHPVVFLFLGGYAAMHMTFSFFLGWLLKFVATKYGGARCYRALKPLMVGVVSGAMLGMCLPFVVGSFRYLLLGHAAGG